MKIARLGAAAVAAGIVALGTAGPALATTPTPPSGDVSKQDTSGNKPVGKPGSAPTADVNPKFFYGGDTLTFTFKNCGVKPTITDLNNLFVHTNPFMETVKGSWAAKETTHKNLVAGREYKVKVVCGEYTVTFSTRPRKKPKPTPTSANPTSPTKPPTTVPSGAPQTGDGSANGGGNTGLMVGGVGVVVLGLAGGGLLYARRRSSAGA